VLSDKPLSIFVDFDSIDGIVGVSPCHFQARTRISIKLMSRGLRPLWSKGPHPIRANPSHIRQSRPDFDLGFEVEVLETF
jgi:hypothetical protein